MSAVKSAIEASTLRDSKYIVTMLANTGRQIRTGEKNFGGLLELQRVYRYKMVSKLIIITCLPLYLHRRSPARRKHLTMPTIFTRVPNHPPNTL